MKFEYMVTVDYEHLDRLDEDRLDAIYYFMKYRLGRIVSETLQRVAKRATCKVFRLGEIVDIRSQRITPATRTEEMFYLIEAEDIDGVSGGVARVKLKRHDELAQVSFPRCYPGDILFLRLRIYQRKVAIVPDAVTVDGVDIDLRKGVVLCQPEVYVITLSTKLATFELNVDPQVLKKYLWCFLRSDLTLLQLLPLTIGGTRPRIKESDLLNLLVPIPSEEDVMREIVKSVDNAVSKVKDAVKQLTDSINKLWRVLGADFADRAVGEHELASMGSDVLELLVESGYLPKWFLKGIPPSILLMMEEM